MTVLVYQVEDRGGDVLYVRGSVDGVEVEALGWVSATTNHYDPADVGEDGYPKPGAKTRAMTAAEARAYVEGLLNPPAPVIAPSTAVAAIKLDPEPTT